MSPTSHAVLISERQMFIVTFGKLLETLISTIQITEHRDRPGTVEKLPDGRHGVVIFDAGQSSDLDIISSVLALLSVEPEAHVVVVIDELNDDCVQAAMDTGSLGVIVKSSPPQVLIEMLQRTLNGERCRPAPVRALSREDIPEDLRLQLSARQQKMLRAVVGGQSVSATARELNITPAKLVNEMRLVMSILRGRSF